MKLHKGPLLTEKEFFENMNYKSSKFFKTITWIGTSIIITLLLIVLHAS